MSLIKDKTTRALKEKRSDLVKYIQAIDKELSLRETDKKSSFLDNLLSTSKPKTEVKKKTITLKRVTTPKRVITPRSCEIRASKAHMQEILTKNGVKFKSSFNKATLEELLRKNRLIKMVECKNKVVKNIPKEKNLIRATNPEMKQILRRKGIDFKSSDNKATLSELVRENKLIREVEELHMMNQK